MSTTVSLIQIVTILAAVVTNASLQSVALARLDKYSATTPFLGAEIASLHKLLLGSIIAHFLAALIAVVTIILLSIRPNSQVSTIATIGLYFSGLLLLTGGIISANVAVRLQCLKGDPQLYDAWYFSTTSALIGVLGTIVLLAIQATLNRQDLKKAAISALIHENVRVPTYKYDPENLARVKQALNPAAQKAPSRPPRYPFARD